MCESADDITYGGRKITAAILSLEPLLLKSMGSGIPTIPWKEQADGRHDNYELE
jgi:hypothetical protein